MKNKKVHKAREAFKIKNQILKIVPTAKDIDVKIDKVDPSSFETLIKVYIPPQKKLVALKKDKSLKLSIEKSRQAILRQIQKIKTKRERNKSCKIDIKLTA